MSQRVADATTTDAVPVRQVADVILSFGLELPTVPGPRRPRRSSGAHRLAEEPPVRPHMGADHMNADHLGADHIGADPGAESGASRTVTVAPEVLAKARRLAFGPPLPPLPAQRGPRTPPDDAWAPTTSPTTAVPAPRRHHDDDAPHTTLLPLQTRGPVADDPWAPGSASGATRFVAVDRADEPDFGPDDEPDTDPFGFDATAVTAAADVTTVNRPVRDIDDRDDDTALVTQDEPYPDIDRPITSGKGTALGNARRGRSTRQLAVVTAAMASVAIVGAAAAAVVSLSNSGPSPADNAPSDLDLAHQAAPPKPADAPQTQTSTQAPPTTQATTGATDHTGTTAAAQGGNGSTGSGTSARATTTTTRAPAAARAVPVVNASGKSAAAAQVALQQIGKPYKWGSTGPSSFDCSGLVFYAFQQMGVTLPRTAAAMSQVGTPVSKSQLKPGDLVFFYSPVSHVAIYIGDGKVVNATTDGEPVQVSPLSDFPMTSARRV